MRLIPILSSLVMLFGCFLPWFQIGPLFSYNGTDSSDIAPILMGSIVAGGLALHNKSKDVPSNTWIYLIAGVVGVVTIYLFIESVGHTGRILSEGFGDLSKSRDRENMFSVFDFVGSGLYMVIAGSGGLVLSGLGFFNGRVSNESVIGSQSIQQVTSPKYVKKIEEEKSEEQLENEKYNLELLRLNKMLNDQLNASFGGSYTEEIHSLISSLAEDQESAIHLLNAYQTLFKKDLIDHLKGLSSSYSSIKRNVSIFIELGIIDADYPHGPKA